MKGDEFISTVGLGHVGNKVKVYPIFIYTYGQGRVTFATNSLRALRLCELTVLVAFEICVNGVIGLVGAAIPIARALAELSKSRRIA